MNIDAAVNYRVCRRRYLGPDGRSIYYVSERLGTPANVVRQVLGSSSPPERLTDHKTDGVRLARISRDGKWIVYECGADLWITSTAGKDSPRKLAIEVHADDKDNSDRSVTLSQGISEYALSTDERTVAFTVMGEVFICPHWRQGDPPHRPGGQRSCSRLVSDGKADLLVRRWWIRRSLYG